MSAGTDQASWYLTGFQATVALWVWVMVMLLHCIFRLWTRPGADPIRPSGPVD
jgi:hypothetical protein